MELGTKTLSQIALILLRSEVISEAEAEWLSRAANDLANDPLFPEFDDAGAEGAVPGTGERDA